MRRFISITFVAVGLFAFGGLMFAQPVNETPRDQAYPTHIEKEKAIIPYDPIREADVFWQKRVWRIIDCNEKINLPFVYPKAPFIQIILDAVKEGTLQAYDPIEDEFNNPYDYDAIDAILNRTDTVPGVSPYTYNDTLYITNTSVDPLSIRKYRIKEDWIFDEETSTMVCRIRGIAPVRDVLDPTTGEFRGTSVMFWIHYEQARQLMNNTYAYNPRNDAVRMSWQEVFEMRMFSSYIIKESNVYDREIETYKTGIDAVLESEKIKTELFRKEHELWTF